MPVTHTASCPNGGFTLLAITFALNKDSGEAKGSAFKNYIRSVLIQKFFRGRNQV
jgi:hypothetical protein